MRCRWAAGCGSFIVPTLEPMTRNAWFDDAFDPIKGRHTLCLATYGALTTSLAWYHVVSSIVRLITVGAFNVSSRAAHSLCDFWELYKSKSSRETRWCRRRRKTTFPSFLRQTMHGQKSGAIMDWEVTNVDPPLRSIPSHGTTRSTPHPIISDPGGDSPSPTRRR